MANSFRRWRDAAVIVLSAAVLPAHGGCTPADWTAGTTTTADAFNILVTFVGDFLRQILAAFLF